MHLSSFVLYAALARNICLQPLKMGSVHAVPPQDVVPTFDPNLGFPQGRKERGEYLYLYLSKARAVARNPTGTASYPRANGQQLCNAAQEVMCLCGLLLLLWLVLL